MAIAAAVAHMQAAAGSGRGDGGGSGGDDGGGGPGGATASPRGVAPAANWASPGSPEEESFHTPLRARAPDGEEQQGAASACPCATRFYTPDPAAGGFGGFSPLPMQPLPQEEGGSCDIFSGFSPAASDLAPKFSPASPEQAAATDPTAPQPQPRPRQPAPAGAAADAGAARGGERGGASSPVQGLLGGGEEAGLGGEGPNGGGASSAG